MELIRQVELPEGYGDYETQEFGEGEKKDIENFGAEIAFYWYGPGDYCGAGKILMLKNGQWFINDCGHCSCYGPTENINDSDCVGSTLEEVEKKHTEDANKNLLPLIALAKQRGYK